MKKYVLVSLLLASPAFAQTRSDPVPIASSSQNGLAITTSTALTVPAGANYGVVCAVGGAANWETDTSTPTGTAGTGGTALASGACVALYGSKTLQNFLAIQQTGNTTTLNVKYYKYQ